MATRAVAVLGLVTGLISAVCHAQTWQIPNKLQITTLGAACTAAQAGKLAATATGTALMCNGSTYVAYSAGGGGGGSTQTMITNQSTTCTAAIDGQVRINTTTGKQQVCIGSASSWRDLNGPQYASDCATKASPGICTSVTGQAMYYVGVVNGARLVSALADESISQTQSGTFASAVKACEYKGTGWFLPILVELQTMYANKAAIGGFVSSNYWSSGEAGYINGWYIDSSGTVFTTDQGSSMRVRCARRD